jgi:GTP-binding protein
MDATEMGVARDQHIAGMAVDAGKGLILCVNKWDLIEKDDHTQNAFIARLQQLFAFCPWAPVVFTSATAGQNVTQLLELVSQIQQRRTQQFETPKLNDLLRQLVAKQPPAGVKNHQPKLNYITQVATEPPTFAIFGSHPDMIHFSYQRYLENGFRQAFDFTGTPLKLEFRDKRKGNK